MIFLGNFENYTHFPRSLYCFLQLKNICFLQLKNKFYIWKKMCILWKSLWKSRFHWFEYHHYFDILNTQVVIFCEEKILIWDKNLNSFQRNSSTKPLKLSLKPTSFCYLSWTRNVDSFRYFWKLHTFSTTFVLFFTTEKHIQNIHENNGKYV